MTTFKLEKNSAGAVLWVVVLLAIAAGVFLYFQKPIAQPAPPIASATPEPTPETALAPPEPTPDITPEPTPEQEVVEETPEPTPTPLPPLTLATVARDRSLWPKEIALTRATELPAMLNGQVIGSLSKPAGSIFRIVNISTVGVDVMFNNAPTRLPAASTDLLVRAQKNRNLALGISEPVAVVAEQEKPVVAAPKAAVAETKSASNGPLLAPAKLIIETIRIRKSRIEGGDWDDKIDRIALRIKMKNPDPRLDAPKLRGTIYIFADSILNREQKVLLGRGSFDCNLAARGETSYETDEFSCAYDTTDARFGYKYGGWVAEFKNATGESVLVKASSPSLEKTTGKLEGLKVNGLYDKNLKFKSTVRPDATNSGLIN